MHDFAIRHSPAPILEPQPGAPWAQTMVLNPAIEREPGSSTLHMLFRATGPGPRSPADGRPAPYPIYLGYARSDDGGHTWDADFSRPALAPALAETPDALWVQSAAGERVVNFANGCIEDPRLTWLGGKLYLAVACRLFPPGPYWEHDDPLQCAPAWAREPGHGFGRAATENLTVSVLYEVDLARLAARDYDAAFHLIGPLTDPERGDNRDAFLFPERLRIDGRLQYVAVHRPREAGHYGEAADAPPSIFLAAADRLEDLATPRARHILLAKGCLPWEGNRVGGSSPPIRIGEKQWLLPYHGKQDDRVGYTQSFMILEEDADGWPRLKHRCADRVLYPVLPWQQPRRFPIPCLFTCGAVVNDKGELVMSYGAADEVAGIAWVELAPLIERVRQFDAEGTR